MPNSALLLEAQGHNALSVLLSFVAYLCQLKGAHGSTRTNLQQRATVRERGARKRSLTLTTSKMMGAKGSARSIAQQCATLSERKRARVLMRNSALMLGSAERGSAA
jgi:hypothetical protein